MGFDGCRSPKIYKPMYAFPYPQYVDRCSFLNSSRERTYRLLLTLPWRVANSYNFLVGLQIIHAKAMKISVRICQDFMAQLVQADLLRCSGCLCREARIGYNRMSKNEGFFGHRFA